MHNFTMTLSSLPGALAMIRVKHMIYLNYLCILVYALIYKQQQLSIIHLSRQQFRTHTQAPKQCYITQPAHSREFNLCFHKSNKPWLGIRLIITHLELLET